MTIVFSGGGVPFKVTLPVMSPAKRSPDDANNANNAATLRTDRAPIPWLRFLYDISGKVLPPTGTPDNRGIPQTKMGFSRITNCLVQNQPFGGAEIPGYFNFNRFLELMNGTGPWLENLAGTFLPRGIDGFESLAELALDLRWSWNHRTDTMWRELDPVLWNITHNPWIVLQTVSRERLEHVLGSPSFRADLEKLVQLKRQLEEAPVWFQETHGNAGLTAVAYFSMEFMLSEGLPIYSGGLGNVAGDQLKAASDLGVPVIGIGLLYQQGYFRQIIDKNGAQQALFPYNDPGQLPITPLREPNGEWLRLEVALPGYSVWLRAWQVQVGRIRLYLLDTNDSANFPIHRGITSELYGDGPDIRLKQELVLGIGGWRLLRKLGIRPEVCHLNEGHAAFAALERAHAFMEETGQPFELALEVTRAGNLFTTHTAVAAGFDHYPPALIEQYLTRYAEQRLGISITDLLALGRLNPKDRLEHFNMAYLAVRGSGAVNGVSRLHAKVSRKLFAPLFPRWPEDEVPIGHVTNGVHGPTWDSAAADDLWTCACGKNRWLGGTEFLEKHIREVPGSELWKMRTTAREGLIQYARQRLVRELAASGFSAEDVERARHLFSADTLTLGFARRFTAYKRPNLLLHDPVRLLRILTNPQRPVQLILAGKAHPADKVGQALIQQWTRFIRLPEVRPHAVFLADYDIDLTAEMVRGVDLWINTPRRPWEACGTSGMKILVNGGLNFSELDGWWAEAYSPDLGWALGDGLEHSDDAAQDAAEAESLYDQLENEVIPAFYNRDENGIPTAWVERMRESMARLTPRFSANRTVREYVERHYLPAAAAYRERAANKGASCLPICQWRHTLEEAWSKLRFDTVKIETAGEQHLFEVQVYLAELNPDDVAVELFANGSTVDAPPFLQPMTRVRQLVGTSSGFLYRTAVPASRPARDYTARIIPHRPGVAVPLEVSPILWQQ